MSTISATAQGLLFTGTDAEEFAAAPLPDRLGRFMTLGPAITGGGILPTNFFINGMGHAGGNRLYAGDPLTNTLNTIDFSGNLLNSIPAGFPAFCCNEDMILDRANSLLYHAHHPEMIQTLDPTTGLIANTFPQQEPVGMTWVGNEIWITHWAQQVVGKWDPATNVFTPVFNTPNFAGGLAYDPLHGVLWVGERGGFVTPYDTTGLILGPSFQPFGPLGDTADGLEFVPMAKIDLKPGSNPNCVNPNSGGNVAVAIFGSAVLDVTTLSNVQFGGASALRCSVEDVPMEGPNPGEFPLTGDGIPDLVCHFNTQAVTWPAPGTSDKVLLTADISGTPIQLLGADIASIIGEAGCPARGPFPLEPVIP
jgi:hypothetical protein